MESFARAELLAQRTNFASFFALHCLCEYCLLLLFVSPELAIPQNLAIGEHDFIEAADRITGFRRVNVNRDDVTGLQRIPVPAK